jgi:hypothetical protein
MGRIARLTAKLRTLPFYEPLRTQLDRNGIDPSQTVLAGIRALDCDEMTVIMACKRNELLFVDVKLVDPKVIGWVRRIETISLDDEPWDAENAIINRIIAGDLAGGFERAVRSSPDYSTEHGSGG